MDNPDHNDCSWLFCLFCFGSLHTLVLFFELWNSCISKKSYFCCSLMLFLCLADEYFFFILIILFLPLQVIYSSKVDFHQTLIKKILVNLVNTLAILSMVKWIKPPTFNFIYFIMFQCDSSGLGYRTCSMPFTSIKFFPFCFLTKDWIKTATRQIRISLWKIEWEIIHIKWYFCTVKVCFSNC